MSIIRQSSSPQRTSRNNCCTAWCTMGPRQVTDWSSGIRNPKDIIFMSWAIIGRIFCPTTPGWSFIPIIVGILGPYISASSKPTLAPASAIATERFTETVDLPTPPFPLATATIVLTPGSSIFPD